METVAEYAFPQAGKCVETNATQTTGATVPSWTTLAFPVTLAELDFPSQIIEKLSDTQFRVNYRGVYLFRVTLQILSGANNLGCQARVTADGTPIPQSLMYGNARASTEESLSIDGQFPALIEAGSVIEVQAGVREGAALSVLSGSDFEICLRRLL